MANYSKVQFLSWELYTGPKKVAGQPDTYAGYQIPGGDPRTDVASQYIDLMARVGFTQDAVEKAYAAADQDADTLKVFMAPEFLYRGAGGAYFHDLLNGTTDGAPADFDGLISELAKVASDAKYQNWVFVFGTAITAAFDTSDQNGTQEIDLAKAADVYNFSYIHLGGSTLNTYSQKQFLSGIDFVRTVAQLQVLGIDNVGTVHDDDVPVQDLAVNSGGVTFSFDENPDDANQPTVSVNDKALVFGNEICLDHSLQRLAKTGTEVDIQLVPSGGMTLMQPSLSLTPKGYAFNCDGLGNNNGTYGSHVQIASTAAFLLFEADATAPTANTVVNTVNVGATAVNDVDLWSSGAGYVRASGPYDLV